jgi:FimV-like protein
MITLLIKSYLTLFISIGLASILILSMGIYWIYQSFQPQADANKHHHSDYEAIAGDDIISTQLDLARAYIETDNKTSARKILDSIMSNGSHHQQEEAQRLLSYL